MRIIFALLLPAVLLAQSPPPTTLTLSEAEESARRNNPQIAAARLGAEAAGYLTQQTLAASRPQLTAGLSSLAALPDSRLTGTGFTNPALITRVGFGATVNQLLTDFGRTKLLGTSVATRASAESFYASGTQAVTLLLVRQAFFSALRAQNVLRVAGETVRARETIVDQIRALANASIKSGLDLSFVEVSLSEARLIRAVAINDRDAAFGDLSLAMGLSAPRQFTLAYQPPPPDGLEEQPDLLSEALSNRPDLVARKLEAEAADQFARAEEKLDRPIVSATGVAGYSPAHSSNLLRDEYVAGGVTISLPILNGGAFRARQAEAKVRARAARLRVTDIQNRISRDIGVAQLNIRTAIERVNLTRQLVAQSSQALELAQARYDLGLSTIVELNQAQLAKLQAEIQSTTAAFDYQLQRGVLEFQLGRLR